MAPVAAKHILLVEDSADDVLIFQRAVKKAGVSLEIHVANDGSQAIDCLRDLAKAQGSGPASWWPDLVLLDLKLPEVGGLEVLNWIQKQTFPRPLSVVILTNSEAPNDIQAALRAGAHSFIVKPSNPAELVSRMRPFLHLAPAVARLDPFAENQDETLGILAHNLKSMLGGILMNAEILHDRAQNLQDVRLGELAENILQSSSRMMRFVREFLANSAADHGVVLSAQEVSLADAAARNVQEYEEIAKRKNLVIRLVLAGSDALVRVDPMALDQVLDNLLSNAVKFSPLGKEILVSVRTVDRFVECAVQDQGPGITEEDKGRLFGRFARLSARPTAGEPSTGLGLSIVKKMTAAMGGTVHCESEPGQGTTFRVRFPRAARLLSSAGAEVPQ